MLHALTLAALLAAAEPAPLPDAASVPQIGEFLQALVHEEVRTLLRNNPPLSETRPRGLPKAIRFYSCMEVTGVRVVSVTPSGNDRRLLIDIDGTGIILGAAATREPLPNLWSLTLRDVDGKTFLAEIEQEDIRLARTVYTAKGPEIQAILDERPDIDVESFLHHVGDYATDQGEQGRAALDFVIDYRRRTGASPAVPMGMKSSLEIVVGNHDAALALAREALRIAEERQNPNEMAGANFETGIAHWMKGEIDQAVRALDASFALIDHIRDPRISLKAAHMASHLDAERGRLSDVVRRAHAAGARSKAIGWTEGVTNSQFSLAGVHHHLGNLDVATRTYREAFELSKLIREPGRMAVALSAIGSMAADRGDYELARTELEQALELMQGKPPSLLLQLAEIRLAQGDREAATALTVQATEAARADDDRTVLPRSLAMLARLKLDAGNAAEAVTVAEEAIDLANKSYEGKSRATSTTAGNEARIVLARALRRLEKPAEARVVLEQAINISEAMMPELPDLPQALARYSATDTEPHHEMIDLMLAEGRAGEAVALSAQLKARSLQQILARGHVDPSASFSRADIDREQELEGRVVTATRDLLTAEHDNPADRATVARARSELDRFRGELYYRYPGVHRRRPALQKFDESVLQDPRLQGVLVLDFLVREDRVLVLAIEPGKETAIAHAMLPIGHDELSKRIDRYLDRIVSRDLRDREDAAALYDLLLRPIEPALRRHQRICVIPDGPLWKLPFQTLGPRGSARLADEKAFFLLPSLSLLGMAPSKKEAAPQQLLAVANPSFPGMRETTRFAGVRKLPRESLADAAREGRSLLRIYDRGVLLESAEATEEKVTESLARFRILHFATHGIVEPTAPMYSALLLASSSKEEDGALEAREIADLRLTADLAVLSACDTARGQVASGEGVIGLAWAFAVAGCPRTVASQWQVDSRATADLMIAFHRHVRAGVVPAEALRLAQLELRKNPRYRHAYYWAPFVVIGDGMTALF
ncbi:MAG TPA: CHAT domain-containing protein [Thermoanaerobaculia bacterium]|nr:CHAT domain-containing protein [Thermoanaerobaculia bacterium]